MIGTLRGSDEIFLNDLDRIQQNVTQAQQQVTSGRKVNSVADAPDEIAAIFQLQTGIGLTTTVQSQLGNIKTLVDTADQAVQTGVQLVDRAATLADQAASSLQTPQSRVAIAQEIQGILEQMVALSCSSAAGRYVFSGDADRVPCYEIDSTSPTGVRRLVVPQSTIQIGDGTGFAFSFSKTAQEVFDHRNADDSVADDNVFAALSGLIEAVQQNDTVGIQAAAVAVRQASDYLNSQSGFYGAVENRLDSAIDISKKFQVQQQADLSERQDADLTAAALQLSQAQVQQQAALSARAALPKTSLFDYLG